jgi:pyridoxal phosphate enzyme (YggS family)
MALSDIQDRLTAALEAAGRPADDATLIAVSKVQPPERVAAVLDQGHRVFGENRVQEAQGRWPDFQARYDGIALHLIGPLQTNKARAAVEMFDAIHTVDRPQARQGRSRGWRRNAGKAQRSSSRSIPGRSRKRPGCLPADVDAFVAEVRALDLPLSGLMCIPPIDEEPSLHFALLAKIAERNGLKGLSMGMSADFEKAISWGATHVRVGSAIFGARVD